MISIGNLQINKLCLGDVEVTKAYLGDVQVYGSTPQPVGKYMTMTVLDGAEGTTISPKITGSISPLPNLQYRVNNGSWTDFVCGTTADIHVVAGDVVNWKGVNESGISTSQNDYLKFSISGNTVALSGNIMSLIDGVGDALEIPCNYCFYRLFSTSNVKTVSSDFLPATTLTPYCYQGMFINCTTLEIAPELPATIVKNYCYSSMFNGCTSLVTAPELPATTLASNCYSSMFNGCTSLVTAHELPATTLTNSCYSYMFCDCTSLTQAPALPATTLDDYCYEYMFNGCTELVNAPVLPATTLAYFCYYSMFWDCTSLTQAPELPATTLDDYCYKDMFNGCTSLTTAPKILPATTLASYCYNNMFYGCTSLTQAPVLPATTLASYCCMFMFGGCTSLKTAPALHATTLAPYCYHSMFRGCQNLNYVKSLATDITETNALTDWLSGVAATGTFVKPAGVSYVTGGNGIPQGWTVEEIDAPIPPEPEGKYMTMTVLDGDAGTNIAPTVTGTLSPNLQYRVNNGSWNDFIVGTTADIHAAAGDVVQFKGVNESGISTSDKNYLNFAISGNPVALSGNVMSLIDGVGDVLEIPCNYCFYRLFHGSSIKTVSPDFLPATTITNGCYFDLFSGSPLENAPELPALTMQENCYRGMFYGCQKLTQAPSLPATTLAIGCYAFMLANCSSLVQVPELYATELAQECYRGLFQNCTALTQAPSLPATTLANGCYSYMFSGCSSLVNAPVLPATTLVSICYKSMFYNCTSLTKAPELPATTLADNCYQFMFWGCSNLTQAPEILPATTLTVWCYEQMFCNCTSLTQAPVLPATTLTDYCYRWMFYGDSKLNYVKSLATDITATNALYQWLSGVASTGTFVKPIGVGYPTGASGIPKGWTIVEEKPKPEGKYMTMTVLDGASGTTISPTVTGSLKPKLQYRINSNGDWTNFIVGTTADIHLVSGDWVQFKGVNESGISNSSNYLNFAISGNPVALSGNVMSLIDGVGDTLVIPNSYCFSKLFSGSKVKTVSSDFLPATTLTQYCYYNIFRECTLLKQAPELPAIKLEKNCYAWMFIGCSSLNYVKCYARNNITSSALNQWLSGVAQTGTFVKRYGVSYPTGSSGIPEGWTIQNI